MLEKVCTRILGFSRAMLKGLAKMELMVGGGVGSGGVCAGWGGWRIFTNNSWTSRLWASALYGIILSLSSCPAGSLRKPRSGEPHMFCTLTEMLTESSEHDTMVIYYLS